VAQPLLTTPGKVKSWLRDTVHEKQEWIIELLIESASSMIREVTGRSFTSPRETNVLREQRTYGTDNVYFDELVAPGDILGVADENGVALIYDADFGSDPVKKGCTITIEPAGSYGSWRNGGLLALPPDHGELFLTEISYPTYLYDSLPRKIVLRGNFGWEEIPAEIEFATRRTVGTWFKEEVARYSADAFISRGRVFEPEALPPLVQSQLSKTGWIAKEEALVF
jgi:hypothetical protein